MSGTVPTVAPPRHVVPLLAAFASLVVLTTDVYLPVLPRVSADLHTSNAAASATVSGVLVGIAVGQVVIGPLSDAVGRRAPLLLGAAAYALLHVLGALSTSIGMLLTVRVLAGFATAACIVVGRAVVVDLFPGAGTTRAFAVLGAVTSIVPVVAPVAGSLLALVMGWRGMFLVLAVLAVLLTGLGWRALPESLPPERRSSPHLGAVLRDLGAVLRIRSFLAYAAAIGAVGIVLFGYIGASSFALQDGFGLSPQQYGLVFALNSVGIFAGSNLAARLAGRVPPARLLATGQSVL
ncbi:MAG: Bcr/CflA family efflux MFS transporter, partial [Marmoricola sp.]|nr:Bcr/CflA family efflux MFS transporter [Marmoricola sp.]